MKKVFRSLSLLAIAGATLASVSSCSVFGETYSYEYDKETKGYAVLGLKNYTDNNLEIPSKHKGKKVTKIADNAFNGWEFIKSVKLPSSLKEIGNNSFNGCNSLKKVSIPNKVETIGDGAFANCLNLKKVNVPNNLVYFGDNVFDGTDSLEYTTVDGADYLDSILIDAKNVTGDFKVKEGTKYIGSQAFKDNDNVTKIDLGNEIYSISGEAFKGVNLSDDNLIIPESVSQIGTSAFDGSSKETLVLSNENNTIKIKDFAFANSSLKTVDVTGNIEIGKAAFSSNDSLENVSITGEANIGQSAFGAYDDGEEYTGGTALKGDSALKNVTITEDAYIGSNAFSNTISLTEFDANKIIEIGESAFDSSGIKTFTIPATAEKIGKSAFANSKLQKITFDNVKFKEVSDKAFEKCESLLDVDFKESKIEQISYKAFNGDVALTNITFPTTLVTLGSETFANTNLTSVNLSNCTNFKTINSKAFNNCDMLEEVKFNTNLELIGQEAFADCAKLDNVVLSNNTIELGISAFKDCTSLTSITMGEKLTNLPSTLFEGCTSLTTVKFGNLENKLPNNIVRIGSGVFSNTALTSFEFNDSMLSFGSGTFENVETLISVHLPSNFNVVPDSTFKGCTSLNSVNVSENVTRIGANAFEGCTSLARIDLSNANISVISGYAFSDSGLTSMVLPETIVEIGEYAFSDCKELADINIPNSLKVIGTKAFENINDNAYETVGSGKYLGNDENKVLILVQAGTGQSKLEIADGTQIIYSGALMNNTDLVEVNIPAKVTTLASESFKNCTSLQKVTINGTELEGIGESAFEGCVNLITLEISQTGIKRLENAAFYGCEKLETIVLPNSLVEIGQDVFGSCTRLSSVTLGNNTSIIGICAFGYNESLVTINTLNVEEIGERAFEGCINLENVVFGDSIVSIGASAFADLTKLKAAEINSELLSSVGESAFSGCTGLEEVKFGKYLEEIGTYAFYGCESLGVTGTAEEPFIVNIPNIVNTIGASAFEGCINITDVVIGSYVSIIGNNAFADCSKLKNVTFNVSSVENTEVVYDKDDVVALAENLVNAEEATLANEEEIVTVYNAFNLLTETKQLEIISENQALYENIINCYNKLLDLGWEKTTTKESDNYARKSLTVDSDAFINCNSIAQVRIDGVSSTVNAAIYLSFEFDSENNTGAGDIYANPLYYSKKLYTYDKDAKDYIAVENLDMSDLEINTIGTNSFAYWEGKSIRLNDTVEKINKCSFRNSNFEEITFGKYVDRILDNAFMNSKVKKINTSDYLRKIGSNVFTGCNIEYIALNTNLAVIQGAFDNCKIKDVYFSGSEKKWNSISGTNNQSGLVGATKHYNSRGPQA